MLPDFDLIVLYLENALIVLMAVVGYLYLVSSVYPRLTLRAVWRTRRRETSGDRGVRKLVFPGGRAIVYEPIPAIRRFIRRYALIKQDGCTYIQCRIHDGIAHIRYDVISYDCRGRLLDVLTVSEMITEAGYTARVRLPRETAYARVDLQKADAMYNGRGAAGHCSLAGMAVYACLTVATSVAAVGLLYRSLHNILVTLPLDGALSAPGTAMLVAGLAGMAVTAWGLLMYRIKVMKL